MHELRRSIRHAQIINWFIRIATVVCVVGGVGYLTVAMFTARPQEPVDPVVFIRLLKARALDSATSDAERAQILHKIGYVSKGLNQANVPDDIANIVVIGQILNSHAKKAAQP